MFGRIYDILGESLNVLSDRQNIIASNVANAETPGYKAKELNFEKVMRTLVPSSSALPMKTTSIKDVSAGSGYPGAPGGPGFVKSFIENRKSESVPTLDGNTVNLSDEMSDMASNSIRFEAVSGLLSKKFAELNTAITTSTP